MAQGRSLLKEIFNNFINSLKLRNNVGVAAGKDYMGTIYYEKASSTQGSMRKSARWFVPPIKDDFQQEIPPEWEAWLRHRRKDPPTEEEIQTNLLKMHQQAQLSEKPKPKISEITSEKPSFPKYGAEYEVKPGENP